jgi:hypothetical protein
VDDINTPVSQLTDAETVDPPANHFIHPERDQLTHPLRKVQVRYGQLFLVDDFSIFQFDEPNLRGEVKPGRNAIPKEWNGNLHMHRLILARRMPGVGVVKKMCNIDKLCHECFWKNSIWQVSTFHNQNMFRGTVPV